MFDTPDSSSSSPSFVDTFIRSLPANAKATFLVRGAAITGEVVTPRRWLASLAGDNDKSASLPDSAAADAVHLLDVEVALGHTKLRMDRMVIRSSAIDAAELGEPQA